MFNSKLILSLLLAGIASLALPVAAAAASINAKWGTLENLRADATGFCKSFSGNDGGIKISSARTWFGWQTAMVAGTFASRDSCLASFNQIVSDCYGTNAYTPATMGGSITDSGGANLVISFGDKAKLGV